MRCPACPAPANVTLVCPAAQLSAGVDGQHWVYFILVILPYSLSLAVLAFFIGWICGPRSCTTSRTSITSEEEDIGEWAKAQAKLIRSRNGATW